MRRSPFTPANSVALAPWTALQIAVLPALFAALFLLADWLRYDQASIIGGWLS